ncbi:MAG TPA: protein-export chaperone SecB [Xanthobacteraceae bacterium]|jgi:preprotein translocase subunit SecB|nr:protein-export chaperone SecB [Xanthobacteraceae bacterium]
MANTNGGPGEPKAPASIGVLGQYIKDLSFENPNAPRSMMALSQQPAVNIQFNVNAKPLSATDYEVELVVEGKAEHEQMVLFNIELVYAGVFRLTDVPQDVAQQIVLIECPRILFPFARYIIANAIRDGGFPPLMIDPVDFAALYRSRYQQAPAAQ